MDEEKNVAAGHVTAEQLKSVAEAQKSYIDKKVAGVEGQVNDIVIPGEATEEEIEQICGIFSEAEGETPEEM